MPHLGLLRFNDPCSSDGDAALPSNGSLLRGQPGFRHPTLTKCWLPPQTSRQDSRESLSRFARAPSGKGLSAFGDVVQISPCPLATENRRMAKSRFPSHQRTVGWRNPGFPHITEPLDGKIQVALATENRWMAKSNGFPAAMLLVCLVRAEDALCANVVVWWGSPALTSSFGGDPRL